MRKKWSFVPHEAIASAPMSQAIAEMKQQIIAQNFVERLFSHQHVESATNT
jgi:hypothetical protein